MPSPLVLCYHAVSPGWEADISTTPAQLERQLRHLLARGHRAVRFSEAVSASGSDRLVAVTFDDAFRSVFEHARPVLARLGMPATLFVPAGHIESGAPLSWPGIDHWLQGPARTELEAMSWSQIETLMVDGWEIGSHTVSHPHLTRLGDDELRRELSESRNMLTNRLGAACESIAYPYGDVDDRVAAVTRELGYAAGAALPARLTEGDRMRWPRIGIYHADDARRFDLKVSPALMALRRSRAWRVVEAARHR